MFLNKIFKKFINLNNLFIFVKSYNIIHIFTITKEHNIFMFIKVIFEFLIKIYNSNKLNVVRNLRLIILEYSLGYIMFNYKMISFGKHYFRMDYVLYFN